MSLKENVRKYGLNKVYDYLEKDPDNNIPKLMDWSDRYADNGEMAHQREIIRQSIQDKDGNWYQLMRSIWNDIDADVRKVTFTNFIINAVMIGTGRQKANKKKFQCNIPWAISLDPTSACNLHCIGCWTAGCDYAMDLGFDLMDEIIEEGKSLGIYMYIFSGGEPLMRKEDVIALCNKHTDCQFLAFTNGTLIDEAFADEMLRVKNFIPALSVEGFEEETDSQRGKGTFAKVQEAMSILKDKKLPFGISCCCTSKNAETLGSEDFFDAMVSWGAKFSWFFTYMPLGNEAIPELMVTAEQREYMYHQVRAFRKSKPIFTIDFWNDGEYVDGCVAGGRRYLHINANGDVEPCAFVHYSDTNLHGSTLLRALQGSLFRAYRENRPFHENQLRSCPVLDNPQKIVEMVNSTFSHSTEIRNPEKVQDLCGKCEKTAETWSITADNLWQKNASCCKCKSNRN